MSRPVKIVLYIACITAIVVFGLKAKEQFRRAGIAKQARQLKLDEASSIENTNAYSENTNLSAEITNALTSDTNSLATNALVTNASAGLATNPVTAGRAAAVAPMSYSKLISYILLCGVGFVAFAFLLGRDIASFFAQKA